MFYILDDLGYIEEVSTHYIERENKTCTEYKGTTPTGYETLDDWVLNANIRAYKIVSGNLTYDADRDEELQAEWEAIKYSTALIEKSETDKKMFILNDNGDYEEILNVKYANNLQNYSTDEQIIGTWIDGKPIYRKVIDCGNLPSQNTKFTDHNIKNLGQVITVKAIVNGAGAYYYQLPFAATPSIIGTGNNVTIRVTPTQVAIGVSHSDLTAHTAIAILEYTKTTD